MLLKLCVEQTWFVFIKINGFPKHAQYNHLFLCCNMQLYEFHKSDIPEDVDQRAELIEKLLKFNVSLKLYQESLKLPNITM